jgi:hypothetical protein
MTVLTWDAVGNRFYEYGLDRGVLYVPGGAAVPWNGLKSVQEKSEGGALTSHFYDGQKYADLVSGERYRATVSAYTYPDEFDQYLGIAQVFESIHATRQPRGTFGLSYRTRVANDLSSNKGHKIHLIYNATVLPGQATYTSLSASPEPVDFSWDIVAVPVAITGFKPSAHIIIDQTGSSPEEITAINDALYGTSSTAAYLPTPDELTDIIAEFFGIIIDNLDGTWTAVGPDWYIDDLDATTFQINDANATYSDINTYTIKSAGE